MISSPVFCAIDRPDLDGAQALAQSLVGAVGGLKLGLEFTIANGPEGVRRIADLGLPVFLDLKLHDIPNTVAGAVRSAGGLGVAMLTIHCTGGPAMLRAAAEAARGLERPLWLLGVTVLTSLDEADLIATGVTSDADAQVLRLADLARDAGLDGIVASPRELQVLRGRYGRAVKLVMPGVRPSGSAPDDQKRTLTPADAIRQGADVLVIGRPITAAPDPRAAAQAIAAEIATAQAA